MIRLGQLLCIPKFVHRRLKDHGCPCWSSLAQHWVYHEPLQSTNKMRFALYDYEMLNICFAPVLSGMNVSAKLHPHNNQMQLPLVLCLCSEFSFFPFNSRRISTGRIKHWGYCRLHSGTCLPNRATGGRSQTIIPWKPAHQHETSI